MKQVILPPLTKALNAYLHLDPESPQRLARLQGKVVSIEFLPFHFIFHCVFTEKGIELKTDELMETHTTIKGTPLQLLGMMINKEDRQHFFADDLVIEGDAELGQQVVDLFDALQIDREDYLSRFIGDVPAYHVNRLITNSTAWLRNTEKSFADNINEYLHEEAALFPGNEALKDFFSDIDVLRMDVDRVEAKIKYLQTLCASQNAGHSEDEVP
jgi:ubiquinone biosynthesis protein UbiJ